MSEDRSVTKRDLAQWLIDNGYAEALPGYHVDGVTLAGRLLTEFEMTRSGRQT